MKRNRTLYVLFAFIAVGVIITIIGIKRYNKPHQVVNSASPAFTVTAAQLIDAFAQDETSANRLYVGKVIQVNGTLKDLIRNDSTLILMLGDTSGMTSVSCYMQSPGQMETANLVRGNMISVKGICNGVLMDVILDKAILLPN